MPRRHRERRELREPLIANPDHPVGAVQRQGPQQHRVDHAEHRGGRAKAQRQRQDGDEGEGRRGQQPPRGDANVVKHAGLDAGEQPGVDHPLAPAAGSPSQPRRTNLRNTGQALRQRAIPRLRASSTSGWASLARGLALGPDAQRRAVLLGAEHREGIHARRPPRGHRTRGKRDQTKDRGNHRERHRIPWADLEQQAGQHA